MRLAASLEIAGRDRGYDPDQRRDIVLAAAEYRTRMADAAAARTLDVWYAHIEMGALLDLLQADASTKRAARMRASVDKIRTRDSLQAFAKLTRVVDGERRILANPPLVVPIEDLVPPGVAREQTEAQMRDLLNSYRRTLDSDRRHLLAEFHYVHTPARWSA